MKFSITDFFGKCEQIRSFLQFPADLVTFTHFLCSVDHLSAVLVLISKLITPQATGLTINRPTVILSSINENIRI